MRKAWLGAAAAIAAAMAAPIVDAGARPRGGSAATASGIKNPGITGLAMCQPGPLSYTMEDVAGNAQQAAIGNWEWQVAHTAGLFGFGKWSAAQDKSVSCLDLGRNRQGLPVRLCTATARPCQR
jgi:hypothetical protein